jgi:uncharacterized protein YdiU (UPF0061 family)
MIGRYISEENYRKLGLDKNEDFNKHASKTLLVILEEDVSDYTFSFEQRMAFAHDQCRYHSHWLDACTEHAQQFGTPIPE